MKYLTARIGDLTIGNGERIAVQTMCNTHTSDVVATTTQCISMCEAGADIIRITCPGLPDVEPLRKIRTNIRDLGYDVPIVADIHFSSKTAIAVAPFVDKVRINPGNFHPDHEKACSELATLLEVCKDYGTAVRIGLNHGSLGKRITDKYGNTPEAMALAAMEWIELCEAQSFGNLVVSLKSSNTVVMVEAYRILDRMMKEKNMVYPLHLGVTEAGNGDSGRIKSHVGISALLEEEIGDTVRVSLTEDPVAEIPEGQYLSGRYSTDEQDFFESSLHHFEDLDYHDDSGLSGEGRNFVATYHSESREQLLRDLSCDWGPDLLDRRIDSVKIVGDYIDKDGRIVDLEASGEGAYFEDELMQACRRRFYKPEYIACPGCGRTMYDLQGAFEAVKEKTSHLRNVVIAVMGCVVNGPGEMADADWGYVGEGNGKVSIYKGRTPVMMHVPEAEAPGKLLELIEKEL